MCLPSSFVVSPDALEKFGSKQIGVDSIERADARCGQDGKRFAESTRANECSSFID